VWLAKHFIVLREKYTTSFWADLSYESPEVECYANCASPMTYQEFQTALNEGMRILKQIDYLKSYAVHKINFNEIQTLYDNVTEIRDSYAIDSHRKWPNHYDTQCRKFGLAD
jgi:hypothetical protein